MSVQRARDEIDLEINLRKRLKGVERAREILEEVLKQEETLERRIPFVSVSKIRNALRELQPETKVNEDPIVQVSGFGVENTVNTQTDYMLVGVTQSGKVVMSTGDGIWTDVSPDCGGGNERTRQK